MIGSEILAGVGVAVVVLIGAAGLIGVVWQICRYVLDRQVAVRVTAKSERRDEDGIRIEVQNRSPERSVTVKDVEVLHPRGLLRRRVPVAAGPFLSPRTPWEIEADRGKDGWCPLRAVDGTMMASGRPKWEFKKPIRVRLKLSGRRGPTSGRFKITRSR